MILKNYNSAFMAAFCGEEEVLVKKKCRYLVIQNICTQLDLNFSPHHLQQGRKLALLF